MPPFLPPEILDIVLDYLHDAQYTLRACCLVSKSWVPRSRKHLFARIEFISRGRSTIKQWKEHFPDPSNSPAHHTRSLEIDGPQDITAAGTDAPAWIYPFRHLVKLQLCNVASDHGRAALRQFHGLSPTLRSLSLGNVSAPIPEILHFICSFPLLENLTHYDYCEGEIDGWYPPRTSPRFTGALYLGSRHRSIKRGLLCLPGGLNFSEITIWQHVEDAELTKELVSQCSGTVESLCIYPIFLHSNLSMIPPPLDLSKCSKLKRMKFGAGYDILRWVIRTLQVSTLKSLLQITIHSYNMPYNPTRETVEGWLEIDSLLAGLWTSHSIVPRITSSSGDSMRTLAPRLLPELTGRGVVCEDEYRR